MFTASMKNLMLCLLSACFSIGAGQSASKSTERIQLPRELVGEWSTGSISSIQYVDPNTGVFKPTVGMGEGYSIRSDGSYVDNVLVQSQFIGADFVYIEGTITVSGNRLTFHQTKNIAMHKASGANAWTTTAAKTQTDKSYLWRIKTEQESGNAVISLCLKDNESRDAGEVCYKKR